MYGLYLKNETEDRKSLESKFINEKLLGVIAGLKKSGTEKKIRVHE